jgi:hypothetical protein
MDVPSIERENVAVTGAERPTYVAPSTGAFDVIVGPATVVKLQDVPPNGVPSEPRTAVVSRTVYAVVGASGTVGVSVAVFDVES